MPNNAPLTPPSFDSFVPAAAPAQTSNTSSATIESPVYTATAESTTHQSYGTYVQDALFEHVWPPVLETSILVSLVLLVGILYAKFRVAQIRAAEEIFYKSQAMTAEARHTFGVEDAPAGGAAGSVRWQEVQRHMQAPDSTGWKQAILEADIMLDDVISSKGYSGDGVGEKMKQVSRADINSIDDAWEAHKVRNRIAHEGSDFDISQRDARRTIALYERVFRELGYIPN